MLIIGLGNPGTEYEKTRHNIGFLILDEIAKEIGESFKEKSNLESEVIETNVNGEKIVLAKPTTFMNNSGRAVQKILAEYKISSEEAIIVHDDVHQDLGQVRLRQSGSSGGNNGIASVIEHIGETFWRVKVGAGKTPENIPLKKWVLSKFRDTETELLEKTIVAVKNYLLDSENYPLEETTFTTN